MNKLALGASALAAGLVLVGGAMLSPTASSQIQASPSYVPIGVSASGNASAVWFHEPLSRQTVVCQTVGQGAGLSIQCARTTLPN